MSTAIVTYIGGLRTQNKHLKSGATYTTDAPLDNHGLGQAFSPTDTMATALANCMLTTMAIKCASKGIAFENAWAEVTKIMQDTPRRIGQIIVVLHLSSAYDKKTRVLLERIAQHCPVGLSIHPEVLIETSFVYQEIASHDLL